jgi:hypothetical protein
MLNRKSYNLKLPIEYRSRFVKPYDKFVTGLLTFADDLTEELIQHSSSNNVRGPKDWMVALNSEDRNEFRKRKLEIMPYATNAQFTNALLLVHERKSAIRIGVEANNGTHCDNNLILDQSIFKVNPTRTQKKKLITTNRKSYKMNGVELLASPV